jgi:hypothetical protein
MAEWSPSRSGHTTGRKGPHAAIRWVGLSRNSELKKTERDSAGESSLISKMLFGYAAKSRNRTSSDSRKGDSFLCSRVSNPDSYRTSRHYPRDQRLFKKASKRSAGR